MHMIKDVDTHFAMPAKKDAGIKRAISEHTQGARDAVFRYSMGKEGMIHSRLTL